MSAVTPQPERIVRRFADTEGPKARESFRCYFNLKRRCEGKPPLVLVEVEGVWYALVEARSEAQCTSANERKRAVDATPGSDGGERGGIRGAA